MAETFIILLAAHLIADFPLQPDWLIKRKANFLFLLGHTLIVVAVAALLLGTLNIHLLLTLFAAHFVMDAVKIYLLNDKIGAFVFDQFIHLATILALSLAFTEVYTTGWWLKLTSFPSDSYLGLLILLSGLIASLHVGAILVRKSTITFTAEIEADQNDTTTVIQGLTNGGSYIGCLERALVMLLVLAGQPAGVGFLIAAKSILRFGDVKESRQRKMTEYIIIGTFMSFGWGLFTAIITQFALQPYLP